MRLAVVGNPDNRRVTLFTEAVLRAGLPAPTVHPWHDVLSCPLPHPTTLGPAVLGSAALGPATLGPATLGPATLWPTAFGSETFVRVESPGEDAEVDRLLRERGSGRPAVTAEHGEIVGSAAAFAGLRWALDRVAAAGGVLLNQPADILTMSDKRRCHALLSAAGIPVPPALPPVHDYASLRAAMADAGWSRVFVKPAHGSSASGVLAFAAAGRRVTAVTSVELSGDKIFNNLRVRRYDDAVPIKTIIDRLGPDGLHVERWYPKASLSGRVLDLRVVVIAGEPRHVVVRTGRSPMTNLHLGNARGDVAAVRAATGERCWAAAMETCARVASVFPATLHAGVDLMFRTGWRDHAVAEVNAFGDLLPRVLADGLDTYSAQVAALTGGWSPTSAPSGPPRTTSLSPTRSDPAPSASGGPEIAPSVPGGCGAASFSPRFLGAISPSPGDPGTAAPFPGESGTAPSSPDEPGTIPSFTNRPGTASPLPGGFGTGPSSPDGFVAGRRAGVACGI